MFQVERHAALVRVQQEEVSGYFRETYRAGESIPHGALPARFAGARVFSTAIYFLLTAGECSALHRIRSDEVWHYYAGSPLTVVTIDDAGTLVTRTLGSDTERGARFQTVVPAGAWFGAMVAAAGAPPPGVAGAASGRSAGALADVVAGGAFTLVGCTVAPGFDFADLELGARADLLRRYPQHRAVIECLTR